MTDRDSITSFTRVSKITTYAVYSPCKSYRYSLTKTWDLKKKILFIMLNPSTATEHNDDATVTRCETRAKALGFGSMTICNLFAIREPVSKKLTLYHDPIGKKNDKILAENISSAKAIVCAWGSRGDYMQRALQIKKILQNQKKTAFHLGLTKNGHPKHPLYISYSTKLSKWF